MQQKITPEQYGLTLIKPAFKRGPNELYYMALNLMFTVSSFADLRIDTLVAICEKLDYIVLKLGEFILK